MSYGHIVIDNVIPIPSMFIFPLRLLEVTQSADTEAFFVEKRLGCASVTVGAYFESAFFHSILVALNENLALPCEASSQTFFFI